MKYVENPVFLLIYYQFYAIIIVSFCKYMTLWKQKFSAIVLIFGVSLNIMFKDIFVCITSPWFRQKNSVFFNFTLFHGTFRLPEKQKPFPFFENKFKIGNGFRHLQSQISATVQDLLTDDKNFVPIILYAINIKRLFILLIEN